VVRDVRGGAWNTTFVDAYIRNNDFVPSGENFSVGLRVASIAGSLGLSGDFNEDGFVDAADYVVWRKTDGTPAKYNEWRANFGNTLGSGSGHAAGIPEPTAWNLLSVAVAYLNLLRPIHYRRNCAQVLHGCRQTRVVRCRA
jgi:hypothetical protein